MAPLKQRWRQRLKTLRDDLPSKRREEGSAHACTQLLLLCKFARFVLSFSSFGSEIDLSSLNEQLAMEGRLILPTVSGKEKLQLFQVIYGSAFTLHPWGMLEPKVSSSPPIDLSMITIALIPGLGFDLETKHRLGYGKGYYDRLLALPSSMEAWGVGFLEQAVENLPYESKDVPLNEIDLF